MQIKIFFVLLTNEIKNRILYKLFENHLTPMQWNVGQLVITTTIIIYTYVIMATNNLRTLQWNGTHDTHVRKIASNSHNQSNYDSLI